MMKRPFRAPRLSCVMGSILSFLLIVASLNTGGISGVDDEDRSARYVGVLTNHSSMPLNPDPLCHGVFGNECPGPVQNPFVMPCDTDGFYQTGIFHGFGGVQFCNIISGSEIAIVVDDLVVEHPVAHVTCLTSDGGVHWHVPFATADPYIKTDIPLWCVHHPQDDEGTTRIGVFLAWPPHGNGSTAGEVTLSYQRVGP